MLDTSHQEDDLNQRFS